MSDRPDTGAIRHLSSERPDLLVFEVAGKIHRGDIESMAQVVDAAMESLDEIDILLIFAVFEGATLGAIFDGDAARVSLRSAAHVRKYGVVGAPALAEAMINLFDPLSPVEARTFDLAEIEQARAWIGAVA